VWSARAISFAVKGYSWKLSDIIYGRYVPKAGDYRVKTRRGGNHVDVFLSWDNEEKIGFVIGGNVDDRVKIRKVTLRSMIADGTTHITEVKSEKCKAKSVKRSVALFLNKLSFSKCAILYIRDKGLY
jgi:hypothetical protein